MAKRLYRYFFTPIFLVVLVLNSYGQRGFSDPGNFAYWQNRLKLSESTSTPKELLSTRSIVLISAYNQDDAYNSRSNWHSISDECHRFFAAMGIDPVMYYYLEDVFAGAEVSKGIAAEIQKREIANLIFIDKSKKSGRDFYIIAVTTFNGKETFADAGQEAWYIDGESLTGMMRPMARRIESNSGRKENLLIIERPEYFRPSGMIRARRNETYMIDLRIENIAISETLLGDKTKADASSSTDKEPDTEIEIIFSKYPYKHGYVDLNLSDEELRRRGFQYKLMQIHTANSQARKFLNYKDKGDEKAFTTHQLQADGTISKKDLPANATIYKYYVKHIYTGDVYLGEFWDAATTWQEALNNYLDFTIKALERK